MTVLINHLKRIRITAIIIVLALNFSIISFSQDDSVPIWKKLRYLSEEEYNRRHEAGRDFYPTDPPEGPIYNIAEFAPMEGVLVRYPFGIPEELIAEMSEDVMVTTIVANSSQQNTVTSLYQQNGVNLDNCNFLIAASDSYWTRDYGPWYIIDGNYEIGIVNFPYNRPRPNDNDIPIRMSEFLDVNLFGMDVDHTGGNYMTDGYGGSSSTDLVWTENQGLSHAQIDQYHYDYLGINDYHVLPDPLGDYIEHIDCWGKFLDVDKVLIGQVPESDWRYDDFEYVADYFETAISGWGKPYQVFRVFTPGSPQDTPYTNSLILNNKVIVPITGSQWDDEAIATYEAIMPGYEVIGMYALGAPSWQNTDAIHCRAKGVADRGMLFIRHMPLWGNISQQNEYVVEASVVPLSGESLYPDSVLVYYKVNNGQFTPVTMTSQNDTSFVGMIPGANPGDEISYYIYAADMSGRSVTQPISGSNSPHHFTVIQDFNPNIYINPDAISASCMQGEFAEESLTIFNTGNLNLTYNVNYSITISESFDYPIEDSPDGSSFAYNTYDELGWTEFTVQEEGILGECAVTFTWATNGYPNTGSFRIESPSGTEAQISGSLNSGTYTKMVEEMAGEAMQGTWKIWIEDSFGDGGHEASDITVTLTRTYEPPQWLFVSPTSGTITPGDNDVLSVTCDASELTGGIYHGDIIIQSNDPDEPEIIVPISLDVEALPDVTVLPDSIQFETVEQMMDGIPVMVYNYTDSEVLINYINHENQGIGPIPFFIDPWGITLPYNMNGNDSLELNVRCDLPVEGYLTMLVDTLFVETEVATHKVRVYIDSELLYQSVEEYSLISELANYPNPFAVSTTITFRLKEKGEVSVDIFNIHGELAFSLFDGYLEKGINSIEWNGKDQTGNKVPPGLYYGRINHREGASVVKMMLLK